MIFAKGPGRILSGGQTGADRAALDWALARGMPHGGWCPKGRVAEDGPLDPRYLLTETESAGYRQRTHANVRDSDGTLIANLGELEGGTLDTRRYAEKVGKPFMVAQLDGGQTRAVKRDVVYWLKQHKIETLNIAGPRASRSPRIYAATYALLDCLWPLT